MRARPDAPVLVKRYAPVPGRSARRKQITVAYEAATLERALAWCVQAQGRGLTRLYLEGRGRLATDPLARRRKA